MRSHLQRPGKDPGFVSQDAGGRASSPDRLPRVPVRSVPSASGGGRMTGAFETTVVLETPTPPLPPGDARKLMGALARRLLVPHGSVAVVFADDRMLRELNRRYRGKDRS